MIRDPSLDTLLFLDGESFVVEDGFWVKFEVRRVAASAKRPHGLDYSLTLHNKANERLLGFDNAHPVRQGSGPGTRTRTRIEFDHKHKGARVRSYDYRDAASLLADFWAEVELVLRKGGWSDKATEDWDYLQRRLQGEDAGDCAGGVCAGEGRAEGVV